uniref:hypothetical protein n=1 Tax=Ornithobacterium rhinotracheale TaxID=28251 RepID=UPI0013E29468|nr:hypothetical protein [Ornithobacterium rhinotracheale]
MSFEILYEKGACYEVGKFISRNIMDKAMAKNIVIPFTASSCPEIIEFSKF